MGWLSSWLQDLIMIVLLATFVDMLLPNRSMERYVKLVLSLLILLTLLSPITKLLRSDPVGELKRAMTAMDAPKDDHTSLEQILAQGKRMQASEQQQSLKWTAKELANVMKEQIEENTGAKVQSVEVRLAMKKQESDTESASSVELPVIQHVVVELAGELENSEVDSGTAEPVNSSPISETKDRAKQNEMQPGNPPIRIDPIEVTKVQVETDVEDLKSPQTSSGPNPAPPVTRSSGEGSDAQQTSTASSEHAVQIISLLKENWKIDATQVQVTETKTAAVL
ncbi:stage III sporulation protein AF [Paenibacillus sp. AN1007]|jgi:stage III sporulation protein AF|uniref:Stage III sporulation protein AF n=1 Tax=Paenibacillus sp. AN1007 TaxID=3151385 RepID=A0AAU8NIV0_9BACL